ncbi:unnamed protein product [Penicillium pancosmium]
MTTETLWGPSLSFESIAATKVLASRLRKQNNTSPQPEQSGGLLRRLFRTSSSSLWEQAFDKLDDLNKRALKVDDDRETREISTDIAGILVTVNDQIELSRREQWKIRTRSGKEYLVRDFFQSIEKWVRKFKDVGDALVAFDPSHAGVPWAVIRFLLSAGVDEIQNYSSIFEGVEIVSEFIARYGEVEKKQLMGKGSVFKSQLSDKLIKLYVAILEFLADAKNFYSTSTKKRFVKSFVPSTTPAPDERLSSVEKIEAGLRPIVDRVEAENLRNILSSNTKQLNSLHQRLERCDIREVREQLLPRLNPTFTNNTFERALAARHEGTAMWVFQNEEFISWMEPDHSENAKFLWIHGPPGFGKTVLSANIINHLKTETKPPNYFFCNAEDHSKQIPYAILGSWIAQLIENDDKAVAVAGQFVMQDQQHPLSRQEQWDLLRRICRVIPHPVFVIDGYDECVSRDEQGKFNKMEDARSQFLLDLVSWLEGTNARVLLVSRDTAAIRTAVLELSVSSGVIITHYGILPTDTAPDVKSFSRSEIESRFKTRKPVDFNDIATMATEKADGMFLWVQLMSFKIKPTTTLKGLDKLVTAMPKGLEETYQRDLDRVWTLEEEERDRALMILRWVLFAKRPLTVRELIETLAMNENDDDQYPEENLPDWWREDVQPGDESEEYITDLLRKPLGSLIQLQPGESGFDNSINSTVHFVHYSVKEFLLQARSSSISCDKQQNLFGDHTTENGILARTCLRYLCLDAFSNKNLQELNVQALLEMEEGYPFLTYAVDQWTKHAESENGKRSLSAENLSFLRRLLDPSKSNWAVWCWLEESHVAEIFKAELDKVNWNDKESFDFTDQEIYDYKIWNQMLEKWESNFTGGPLAFACLYRSLEIVKELHEKGLGISSAGCLVGAPLHGAAYTGSLEIAQYLVDHGADTNHEAGFLKRSPIFYTLLRGNWELIEESIETFLFLLKYETNIGNASTPGLILLHETLTCPDTRPLQAMIAKGADVNEKNEDTGRTALTIAARNGQIDHLSILLEAGAETKVEDKNGHTPLFYALFSQKSGAVKVLLEHNTNVNHRDHEKWTAFHFAARFDLVEIADVLLDAGAELKMLNNKGMSPLMVAAHYGSSEMADFLLRHDAQIGHCDTFGQSAFDHAVWNTFSFSPFFWRTCTFLPESSDGVSIDDLVKAMFQKDTVKCGTLLDSLAPKPDNLTLSSLLHIAVACGSLEIVKKLLDWGIDPNFSLPNGRTPLHIAANRDNVEITELLIQNGSATTNMDIMNYTPLDDAVIRGILKSTVQCLIRHGGFTGPNEAAPSENLVAKWSDITEHELEIRETVDGTGEEFTYRINFHSPGPENICADIESDRATGTYTGCDRVSSIERAFAHLPFFSGHYIKTTGEMCGKLIGEDEIRWVGFTKFTKFNKFTRMYWGKVNLEDGSLEGEWGRTPTEPRKGTFKINRGDFNSENEDQALDGTVDILEGAENQD